MKLPPAPVPQILPAEIQEAHDTEGTTAYNRKEDAMLQRLAKMDDVELTTRVGQAKQHPLFAMFEQDVIQPEHDDCSELIYFGLDPIQDLCEFYMYLDTQGCDQSQQADILKDIQQQPPPDQDPPEDCEVESTQMDPQTDKDQSPMTDQTAAELASKASATTSPVPGKLLPDNQLGDSSLFPPPSPVAPATPSPGPTPVAPAIVHPPHVTTAKPERLPAEREPTDLFKPVTREGMRAFWAVMKRQSTDSLLASPAPSHDLPSPAPSPAPVQAVPTASPVPMQTTSSASPVPSATSPVPSQTVPTASAVAETVPTARPVPSETVPTPSPAPSQTVPPASPVPLQNIPVTSPALPAPSAPEQPAPAAASTSPSPPVETTPSTGHTAPDEPALPAEPTADQIKEARATYMRFYRSVRSAKAPVEVTKFLGYNFK